MTKLEEFTIQNKRESIVAFGAIFVLGGGMFATNGDAPIYGFFAYVVGILFTRWAFNV